MRPRIAPVLAQLTPPPVVRARRGHDALSRADVERLLTREDIAIRERTLWRLLYETAVRSAEVLRLDVEDLDMPNRKTKVRRKGGAIDVIVWQTGTARLLPRLLKGRKSGPVFLTDRRARVELPPCDVDQASGRARLSYPAGRGPVQGSVRRRDAPPAEAQRADPRRRGRGQHAHADGQERSHVSGQPGQISAAIGRGPGALAGEERPGEAAMMRWRVRPRMPQANWLPVQGASSALQLLDTRWLRAASMDKAA